MPRWLLRRDLLVRRPQDCVPQQGLELRRLKVVRVAEGRVEDAPALVRVRPRHRLRRLVLELERRYPGLGKQVEEGMAVAIDGEIYQDAYGAELKPGSEIVLIPKIGGG